MQTSYSKRRLFCFNICTFWFVFGLFFLKKEGERDDAS